MTRRRRRPTRPDSLLTPPAPPQVREATPRRRWVFRALAVALIPILCLLGLEGGLRLAGVGHPTRFLLAAQDEEAAGWIPNLRFGWRFFGRSMSRQPASFFVPAAREPHTVRVFVFGESAAYGDPQPEFGLPRLLETVLTLRWPQARFEVINAAMTGINSHVVLPIARDCSAAGGDLWVVYMGNNEVVGPYGAGTVFGRQAPPLGVVRTTVALQGTRAGQALSALRERWRPEVGQGSEWGGLRMFREHRVPQEDPRLATVYRHFEQNVEDIVALAERRRIGLVLATVAVNLQDCAPFASGHQADLTPQLIAQWDASFSAGRQAQTQGDFPAAMAHFRAAGKLDNRHADLQYHWARCNAALGQWPEARERFVLARDLDTLRFRCDSRLNGILRAVAARHAAGRVRLADCELAVAESSPHGLAGSRHFLEHVHLTFEGNYAVAVALARQVEALLPERVRSPASPAAWPSIEDCAARLAWSGWARYEVAAEVLPRLLDPPFAQQSDHREQVDRWHRELEQLSAAVRPDALRESIRQGQEAAAAAPRDWVLQSQLARLQLATGDRARALEAAQRVVGLHPHGAAGWQLLARVQGSQGLHADAARSLQRAIRIDPDNYWALDQLARVQVALGRPQDAAEGFRKALALKPALGPAHLGLGRVLEKQGRAAEAETHYRLALSHRVLRRGDLAELAEFCRLRGWHREALTNYVDALRMNPADATLHLGAGLTLTALHENDQAARHYAEASRLDPGLGPARFLAGLQLGRQGDAAGAVEQFDAAVSLMPDLVEARVNLGVALSKSGRVEEARRRFQEVLQRQPTNAVALRELSALDQPASSRP